VVAGRLLWLTYQAREDDSVPCTVALQEHEWQSLYGKTHPSLTLPEHPPTLRQAVRRIAPLGGFLGRKGDGEPGVKGLWRGFQRLTDIADDWLLFHPQPPVHDYALIGNGYGYRWGVQCRVIHGAGVACAWWRLMGARSAGSGNSPPALLTQFCRLCRAAQPTTPLKAAPIGDLQDACSESHCLRHSSGGIAGEWRKQWLSRQVVNNNLFFREGCPCWMRKINDRR